MKLVCASAKPCLLLYVQSVNIRRMANESSSVTDYQILKLISKKSEISQRNLAAELGLSLGKTNYCLKACIARGLVTADRFRRSDNKRAYAYLLTPLGVEEKARMTIAFLHYKMQEYERLHSEIEDLKGEVQALPNEQNATISRR